jgi:hypothetical protein
MLLLLILSTFQTGLCNVANSTISQKANTYLANKYNPTLHLIAETNTSEKYWLVSDNLLASYALKSYNLTISNAIIEKLTFLADQYNLPVDSKGLPISYKHEALIGDILVDSLRNSSQENGYILIEKENYTILTEVNNFSIIDDWKSYADLVALRGISLTNQNYSESIALAKYWYNFMLDNMWDGNGFADKAYSDPNSKSYHIYQTYKLGLALTLAKELKITNSSLENTIARVVNLCQNPDGGVITGYEVLNGSITPSKTATTNTETTAIIALANIQENYATEEPSVDYLMWVLVVSVVACLIGAIYLLRKFGSKSHNRIQLKKY